MVIYLIMTRPILTLTKAFYKVEKEINQTRNDPPDQPVQL